MGILTAVAGVFLLLPQLVIGFFFPWPEGSETIAQMIADVEAYMAENWLAVFLVSIVSSYGSLALLRLLLGPRDTVGQALSIALRLLIFYLIASYIANLLTGFAAIFFILPGLYIFARFALTGAVIAAEGERSPIAALRRSFALTRGRGFVVLGLLAIVVIVGYVLTIAVGSVGGAVFLLLGGDGIGRAINLLFQAILQTAFQVVLLAVTAAIYRRLTASVQPSTPRTSGI